MPSLLSSGDFMTSGQLHRSAGVLVGQACGDALAAAKAPEDAAGDPLELPAGWSDAFVPAARLAEVAATGADLTERGHRDRVRHAVSGGTAVGQPSSVALCTAAVVGLSSLHDRTRTAAAARMIAKVATSDAHVADACVLWAEAVRIAVLDGRLELAGGLDLVPWWRRKQVQSWIEGSPGQVGAELQAGSPFAAVMSAWSAITTTPVPLEDPASESYQCQHLQDALRAAVVLGADGGGGHTTAMLAGGLLGARWGASAVPLEWTRFLQGEPGLRSRDLIRLGVLTARGGQPVRKGWPSASTIRDAEDPLPAVRLPSDPGTWLGGIGSGGHAADAVMSLCVLGVDDVPAEGVRGQDHVEPWIISSPDPEDNPNHEFALDDAARTILALRAEGRQVLVHCTRAVNRTPIVATRYLQLRGLNRRAARQEVRTLLHGGGYLKKSNPPSAEPTTSRERTPSRAAPARDKSALATGSQPAVGDKVRRWGGQRITDVAGLWSRGARPWRHTPPGRR